MTEKSLSPLQQTSEPMARRVTDALRQAIVEMRLSPGEMLSEQDLARQLGVSRSPVREAFIKLSQSGLVRVLPQRGTQVVKISRAGVEDARFIREAVECAVVREAAARANPGMIAALNDSLARQKRGQRSNASHVFLALDEEFHRLLAETAGRPAAWEMIQDVKPQMDRVRFLDMAQATPRHVVLAQHVEIVEAIKARDSKAAEEAMRLHLGEILRSLPQLMAQYPELFETEPTFTPTALSA
jgi:DNA-binding GntR family transcriptional regulator